MASEELNKKSIEEYLKAHHEYGLDGIVLHIIKSAQISVNCSEKFFHHPVYQDILEKERKRGGIHPAQEALISQLQSMKEMPFCEQSTKKSARKRNAP